MEKTHKSKSPPPQDGKKSGQTPDTGKRISGTLKMDSFWRAIDARSR